MFQKKFFGGKNIVKGFTLVETIVVLVILAILAAATIPSLLGFIDDAKFKTIDNEARVVRNAAQAYATEYSAKGETDEDIANAINGIINSDHALHNLLQSDANGTVFETKVEKGKIKKFNYTKEIINQDEDTITDKIKYAVFDDTKSSLIHETGILASINNIESFKADLKSDLIEEIKSSLTSDQPSSLKSTLTTDLNSNLESSVALLETSLTTNLNSSIDSKIAASETSLNSSMDSKIATAKTSLKTNFKTELGSNVVDLIYPVGSYYVSHSSTSPATLFGGTWTQITDRFLYCANSSGDIGGEAKHTLTVNEMPSHKHELNMHKSGEEATDFCLASGNGPFGNAVIVRGLPSVANWNSELTGGGAAHNNMPPYLTVYCWRRTA